MRVAVIDLSRLDAATGLYPVVNVIIADAASVLPMGYLAVEDAAERVDSSWKWSGTQGFVAPPSAPEVPRA